MELDSSDILGHPTMSSAHSARLGIFNSLSPAQYICSAIALFVLYTFAMRIWQRILVSRERSLRLATRRRYGIPDNDMRPFNVAYSMAVMRARKEDAQRQKASAVDQREVTQSQNIRNRSGMPHRPDALKRSIDVPVPGAYHSTSDLYHPSRWQNNGPNNYSQPTSYLESNTSTQFTHGPVLGPKKGLTRHRGYLHVLENADVGDKKRSFDHDDDEMADEEHEAKTKKTRLQNEAEDQLMDDDERPMRGSKRGARDQDVEDDEDDALLTSKISRGKRARRISLADSRMEVDANDEEADEVAELKSVRGKKRDRAEAGSTFGGDDDDGEAGSAGELEDDKARRRRRKRRTVAKRKSEASHTRGKKRDREGEDEDDGQQLTGESSPERRLTKKRGKRGSLTPSQAKALLRERGQADAASDVSMDGGESVSTSVRMSMRNVGDEWESNGIKYKVGPNFQRLRQALVKKARQKYLMPKDSQHPDRNAHLQVCIETWLTEEEYQEAKAQHLLAWQDDFPAPPQSEHPEKLTLDISSTQQAVSFPQGVNVPGKNLLWSKSTTTTPTLSPAPPSPTSAGNLTTNNGIVTPVNVEGKTYRHPLAITGGLPLDPFSNPQVPSAKRIASTSRALGLAASISGSPLELSTNAAVPPSPGLSDSTNVGGSPRPLKVFSKWEKQEFEARAMMKIREANRRKEMEKEAKVREERERIERAERAERERQERARVEKEVRERMERERQEKERQEKEKKAKEAQQQQAAAAPQITVTAPSTGPASSNIPAPAAAASGFKFAMPGSGATGSGAASSSPFGAPSTQAKSTAGASPFSFGPSASGGATSNAPQAKPYSFGDAPPLGMEQPKKDGDAAAGPNTGPSLLARMGSQAPPAQAPSEAPKPTSAFTFNVPKQEGTSTPSNPFGAPASAPGSSTNPAASGATTAPKFNFGFGTKNITATNTTNANIGAAKPTPSPFGVSASSSSLTGALGTDANKAASGSTPFSAFKTPLAPASATHGTSTTAGNAPLKFNFGVTGGGTSAFGGGSAFLSSSNANTNGDSAKSTFGGASSSGTTSAFGGHSAFGGSAGSSGQSAFGGHAGSTGQSAFGGHTGSAPSPFGASAAQTQNVFGGGAGSKNEIKPTDSKNLFNFATSTPSNTSSTPASTPAANNGSAPLKFSFGTTSTPGQRPSDTPASTPASGATSSPFSFNFGGSSATPGAASTTPASSPFGAPPANATQSAFGTSSTPSVFGAKSVFGSTANQQK